MRKLGHGIRGARFELRFGLPPQPAKGDHPQPAKRKRPQLSKQQPEPPRPEGQPDTTFGWLPPQWSLGGRDDD